MSDPLLARTDREEAISRAYVYALAAAAGYVIAEMDFDRDGVDLQVRAGGRCALASIFNLRRPLT